MQLTAHALANHNRPPGFVASCQIVWTALTFYEAAPTTATTAANLVSRRTERCVGWDCLSVAQKSGIICGIVAVAVLLFLLYMHCLDRAALSRRERDSVRLPGGRRVSRPRHQSPGPVVALLPIAHQWPGSPAHVTYAPAVFSVDENKKYRAQPMTLAAVGSLALPLGMPLHNPRQPGTARAEAAPWQQRSSPVLRPPLGRASTIASNSSDAMPRTSASVNDDLSKSAHRTATCQSLLTDINVETPGDQKTDRDIHSSPDELKSASGDDEMLSLESNAATVRASQ